MLGSESRCLFHVDEHFKMCLRQTEVGVQPGGAAFSRGAMEPLALVENATVVATDTARPPLPPKGSSQVCREPVALPCLDINQVIADFDELHPHHGPDFDPTLDRFWGKQLGREQRRLFATLRFRLAIKLGKQLGIATLHRRGTSLDTESFLKQFKTAITNADTTNTTNTNTNNTTTNNNASTTTNTDTTTTAR